MNVLLAAINLLLNLEILQVRGVWQCITEISEMMDNIYIGRESPQTWATRMPSRSCEQIAKG